jgi:ubiquinone/menaquinone biosynthesis C-methylase UbiE
MEDLNPQARQMADESMVRNLAAQARALWPQEHELFLGYELPDDARILDLGCGTGEITSRLADTFPGAEVLGMDVLQVHIDYAAERYAAMAPRLRFGIGDGFALDLDDDSFDLVVCRHVLQSVPKPERVVAELVRVLKPGGRLHLLAEDYAMMHFHPTRHDTDAFFQKGVIAFGEKTGVDLRIGRRMYTLCRRMGLADVSVRYLIVDTARVDRDLFASIWEAWRDGYAEVIAEYSGLDAVHVRQVWDDMIACIRDPDGYAVWQVPIISALKPG